MWLGGDLIVFYRIMKLWKDLKFLTKREVTLGSNLKLGENLQIISLWVLATHECWISQLAVYLNLL